MATTGDNPEFTHWLKPETPSEVVGHIANIPHIMPVRELLPPSSELIEYEKVQPGMADRIIGLLEKDQSLQRNALEKDTNIARHRLMTSTVVSLSMIATAVAALLFGPAWLSIPLAFGGVLNFALRDLLNRDNNQKN